MPIPAKLLLELRTALAFSALYMTLLQRLDWLSRRQANHCCCQQNVRLVSESGVSSFACSKSKEGTKKT